MENNFNQNIPVPEEPTQDTCQDASQETTAQAAPETAPKPPVKVRRVGTFSLGLMLVAMVVQSLSPILRGLAGLLPLHTLVGGLLQRLHSLLSRTAACKARRAVAMTAATVRPARTASLPPRARAQSRAAVQTTASAAVRMRPAMHSLHRPVPPERRAAAAAVPLLQGTKTRALCSSAVGRRSRSSRTLRSI